MALQSHRLRGHETSVAPHWPEYLMEAACLGIFMISAGVFTALLEYPHSPATHCHVLPD